MSGQHHNPSLSLPCRDSQIQTLFSKYSVASTGRTHVGIDEVDSQLNISQFKYLFFSIPTDFQALGLFLMAAILIADTLNWY